MSFGLAFLKARAAAAAVPSRPASSDDALFAHHFGDADPRPAQLTDEAQPTFRSLRPLTSERMPIPPLAQNIAVQVMQHSPTNKDAQIKLLCDAARDLGFIVRIERVLP